MMKYYIDNKKFLKDQYSEYHIDNEKLFKNLVVRLIENVSEVLNLVKQSRCNRFFR